MKLNRRWLPAGALTLALAALVIGAVVARDGLTQLDRTRQDAASTHQQLNVLDDELQTAQRHAQWVTLSQQLVSQSQALGLQPERWIERRINMRSASLSRMEADRLLRDTTLTTDRLFVPESYEISVLDGRGGLFDLAATDDRGLSLTLRGSFYARESERK